MRHDGVALESCFTYSVGFRAPRGSELGAAFLDWLHERGLPEADYRDARLRPTGRSGEIPASLVAFAVSVLDRVRWTRADVERFLGEYLSEPKAHVVFAPGAKPRALARSMVRLDPKTRLLYRGRRFFINGESFSVRGRVRGLRELADRRVAEGRRLAGVRLHGLISQWARLGYAHLEKA